MKQENDPGLIRQEILAKAKLYYELTHNVKEDFVGGVSRMPYAKRLFDDNEIVNLVSASLDFWLTYGRFSREFEDKLARYLGIKYCALVNSGSSANLLAFMALTSPILNERRIKRGDEVISIAACFPTTVAPIIQYGAVPVFVDIDLKTANIDVACLEAALSKRTKAVILAHTLGNPFNISEVKNFCDRNRLWLVEDNCDALGAKYLNRYTGTWGDIGTSSFYPPHHITTGEGGAVYTSDPLLYRILLSLRDWGRDCWCESGSDNTCGKRFTQQFGKLPFGYDHKYVYGHFGYNLKATDMQAAIGCAQIEKLDGFVRRRQENFRFLYENLKSCEDTFFLPEATAQSEPSWFGFLMTLRDGSGGRRNMIVQHLEEHNIQTRYLFGGNIVKQPCFDGLNQGADYRVVGALNNTDKIMNDSFWIGVYPGLKREMLKYVAEKIKDFTRNQ